VLTGTSEAVVSEVQVLIDGLTEALSKSEESAAVALQKLLGSFIAASDQMHSGKLAKVEAPHVSETNSDSAATNHAPDLFSSSSLAVKRFATQVVEIIKKGGYGLFGSLETLPPENSDGDEFSTSLTSTLLNMYVSSNHPQMRQLLVAWHREGLAVGPRLLCYVSRYVSILSHFSWNSDSSLQSLSARACSLFHSRLWVLEFFLTDLVFVYVDVSGLQRG
jgi:hypothetical protein